MSAGTTSASTSAASAFLPWPVRRRLPFVGVAALVLVLQFARAMNRDFDLDEHLFVAPPALLVQQGVLPYVDYPYDHMPTLVYLYAALTGWAPYKLLAARTVSALCGSATILLLFAVGWRLLEGVAQKVRWTVAAGVALTFACSRLFTYTSGWAWNHDTAVLCCLAAVLLHLRGLRQGRLRYFALAGLLLGLSVGIRLSFALSFVPFALSLLGNPSALPLRRRLLALGLAAALATVALVPALVPLVTAPDQFFFGNRGYHALSTQFFSHIEPQNIPVPARIRNGLVSYFSDPGNAALLVLAVLGLARLLWRVRFLDAQTRAAFFLLAGLVPALAVGVLGPAPAQYQYFYMLLPFLGLAILHAVAAERAEPGGLRRWARVILAGAFITGVTGLPRWYWAVLRLSAPAHWTTVQVHRTGQWVAEHVPSGARVITIDPVVPLEGGVAVYPEYAIGRWVMHVGPHMTAHDRRHFRMAWGEELDRVLAERPPDAVFADVEVQAEAAPLENYARAHGFHELASADQKYRLWVRPAQLLPSP
jgi:4-amino-4-deoxy-L-arabinose transferase-like glycosyltransferase